MQRLASIRDTIEKQRNNDSNAVATYFSHIMEDDNIIRTFNAGGGIDSISK